MVRGSNTRVSRPPLALLAAALMAALWISGTPSAAASPAPVFAKSVVVQRTSGRVLVTVRHKTSLVKSPRAVPLGSVLDVSGGWALIVTAAPHHRTHSVAAHGAKVRITQRRSESGLTQLRLVSQDSRGCRTGRLARPIHYRDKLTLKTRRYHRRTRRSAADPGVFRSVGSDETAENDGPASWTTSDSCAITTVAASAGDVVAAARGSATTTQLLSRHETWTTRCEASAPAPLQKGYCVAVLGNENEGWYTADLFGTDSVDDFDLCVTAPRSGPSCGTWAVEAPDRIGGDRSGFVACEADRPGQYSFEWRVRGRSLGASIPMFTALKAAKYAGAPCEGFFGTAPYPGGRLDMALPANTKLVNRYVLSTGGWLGAIALNLAPTGVQGAETVQGVVYTDANGVPGARVASTQQLVFNATDQANDGIVLSIYPDVYVPAGAYWIGMITGGDSNVASTPYELDSTLASNANDFAAGPSDPFGPFTSDARRLSVEGLYSLDKP